MPRVCLDRSLEHLGTTMYDSVDMLVVRLGLKWSLHAPKVGPPDFQVPLVNSSNFWGNQEVKASQPYGGNMLISLCWLFWPSGGLVFFAIPDPGVTATGVIMLLDIWGTAFCQFCSACTSPTICARMSTFSINSSSVACCACNFVWEWLYSYSMARCLSNGFDYKSPL